MSVNYGDLECSQYMIARQEAESDYVSPHEARLREIDSRMMELVGTFLSQDETLELIRLNEEYDRLLDEDVEFEIQAEREEFRLHPD